MDVAKWLEKNGSRPETFTYLVLILVLIMVFSELYLLYLWLAT